MLPAYILLYNALSPFISLPHTSNEIWTLTKLDIQYQYEEAAFSFLSIYNYC
jgi:hypothetical protein